MTEESFTHTIVDCSTGEVSIVPFTQEEAEQRLKDMAQAEKYWADRDAEIQRVNALKESAKAKLIAGEPLTEEEAAVIVL